MIAFFDNLKEKGLNITMSFFNFGKGKMPKKSLFPFAKVHFKAFHNRLFSSLPFPHSDHVCFNFFLVCHSNAGMFRRISFIIFFQHYRYRMEN